MIYTRARARAGRRRDGTQENYARVARFFTCDRRSRVALYMILDDPTNRGLKNVAREYVYALWPLLRRARTGSSATLSSASRECRCWHGRLIPESRAHGPYSSNDRRCRSSQRRLCSDWWRPFAPNRRGTTESPASDSRLRRTAESPWRRNVFPRRAAGVETADRLRKFNFNPPLSGQLARKWTRVEEKKKVTSLLLPRVYSVRGLFRERVFHDAALYILYRYRDCSFNTPVRYRLYGKTKFSLSMVFSSTRAERALSILYLCAIVFLDRRVEIVSFFSFTQNERRNSYAFVKFNEI